MFQLLSVRQSGCRYTEGVRHNTGRTTAVHVCTAVLSSAAPFTLLYFQIKVHTNEQMHIHYHQNHSHQHLRSSSLPSHPFASISQLPDLGSHLQPWMTWSGTATVPMLVSNPKSQPKGLALLLLGHFKRWVLDSSSLSMASQNLGSGEHPWIGKAVGFGRFLYWNGFNFVQLTKGFLRCGE